MYMRHGPFPTAVNFISIENHQPSSSGKQQEHERSPRSGTRADNMAVSTPAAWSWLDDGDRWKPYEGALAASIEAAFGDAKRDTVDLHAVGTGAGAAGRHSSTYVI